MRLAADRRRRRPTWPLLASLVINEVGEPLVATHRCEGSRRYRYYVSRAEKAAADRRRQAEEAAKARVVRIDALARRGESVWQEVETEIERRNAPGYDKAASLLLDLRAIAETRGTLAEFGRRLHEIRERHARKGRFIERLTAMP